MPVESEGWTDDGDSSGVLLLSQDDLTEERETLLHELMHVVLGTSHSADDTDIHNAIYKISPKLVRLLIKNPPITDYLFGKTCNF